MLSAASHSAVAIASDCLLCEVQGGSVSPHENINFRFRAGKRKAPEIGGKPVSAESCD